MIDKKPKCPVCSTPQSSEHKPFCSKKCAEIDLHHWLTGSYALPSISPSEEEEEGTGE